MATTLALSLVLWPLMGELVDESTSPVIALVFLLVHPPALLAAATVLALGRLGLHSMPSRIRR